MGVVRASAAGVLLTALLGGCAAPGPTLHSTADPQWPAAVELREVPFHAQDVEQCGPAALATVLNNAGIDVTPAALSPLVYLPGRDGSLSVELKSATRRFGLLPYQIETDLGAILEQLASQRPVLVMQNLGFEARPVWHFAVVIGYDATREVLVLRSGTTERLEMSTRRFMRSWDLADRWALVIVEPGDLPAGVDPDAYLDAAAGLEAAGRDAAALRAYRRATLAWPERPLPWLGIGNIEFQHGAFARATQAYEAALERDPHNLVARNNLAQTEADRGCMDRALREIAIAVVQARGTSLETQVNDTARDIEQRAGHDATSCDR